MAAKVWLPNVPNQTNGAKVNNNLGLLDQPAPDKTFSDEPGKEKEKEAGRIRKRAPSPLILTHTS